MLVELRPPNATQAAARRALYEWENSGEANGLSAAVRSELRHVLGIDSGHRPSTSDLAVALVHVLVQLDNSDDSDANDILEQSSTRKWDCFALPRKHLAWSGLAWLAIQHARPADASQALAEVEASARAWATPFALLRLRLLEFERDLEAGDLLRAADPFDELLSRCKEVYGATHPATFAFMARGIALFTDIAQPQQAETLARACWRILPYTDKDQRASLYDLGAWSSVYDPARADGLRERWRASFSDPWPFD